MWLGVDWGTNSSKWFLNPGPRSLAGRIHLSRIERRDNRLTFAPDTIDPQCSVLATSLKRRLIEDPLGQSFWDGVRYDTGTSLGVAIVLSLVALLNDATKEASNRGFGGLNSEPIEIGFALPNWFNADDEASRLPFSNLHQAVMVSLKVWKTLRSDDLPGPGHSAYIPEWNDRVLTAKASLASAPDFSQVSSFNPLQLLQTRHCLGNVGWRYIGESSAAGLPYLRSTQVKEEPGLPGLRKLLVIDVGAGSTDVGYLIKTRDRQDNDLLHYLPPAGTLPTAGDNLTSRLREHYRQQGRRITFDEAETEKITTSDWQGFPSVQSWIHDIAFHAQEYIQNVPDEQRLPTPPGLQIILTGGSGLVRGLGDKVLAAVNEVLPASVNAATSLTSAAHLDVSFSDEAETARRAVSIGAADSEMPSLKYRANL